MRRLVAPVALAAALSACGTGNRAVTRSPLVFGVTGGNMVPFRVTIEAGGAVRGSGRTVVPEKQLSSVTLHRLRRDVQLNGLSSRNCSGTLPDVASRFIRTGGRTVTVHGGCEPRFERLWTELAQAVGLAPTR